MNPLLHNLRRSLVGVVQGRGEQRLRALLAATLLITVPHAGLLSDRPALADQLNICATPGKDGSPSVSGIVNSYYPGSGENVAVGATSIPVGTLNSAGNLTPIANGDLLLIIQMQDADIDSTNTDAYGNGVGGDVSANTFTVPTPTAASGYTSLNNAGRYEYAVAAGPIAGGAIPIQAGTTYSYRNQAGTSTYGQRTYQVVRVPQYQNTTITGTLTTSAPWDGNSGGIVIIDVAQQLTFSAGSVIDVNGVGFRGGGSNPNPYSGGTQSPSPFRTAVQGSFLGVDAPKGEGIAGTPRFVATQPYGSFNVRASTVTTDLLTSNYPNGDEGRGAPGNAGGGGNEHNAGGGGGANGGDGGMGGRSYNGHNNGQPQFDNYVGGFGGKALPADPQRLILGGGGGAGDTNDQTRPSGAGGGGGGLVIIRAGTITGTGTVTARGGDGIDSPPGSNPDAGGGGGAGGTVLVAAASGSTASVSVIASGGIGGDLNENNSVELDGPGAGGGGGAVYSSGGSPADVTSGQPGLIVNGKLRNGTPNGATPGINGTKGTVTLSSDLPTSISGSNPFCQKPDLLMVKRITGVSGNTTTNPNDGTVLNVFVDDTASPKAADDNNPNWLSGYLKGAINGGKAKPGDDVEYTIYFLSSGRTNAQSVALCDFVPNNSTYVTNSLQEQIGTGALVSIPDAVGLGGGVYSVGPFPSACTGTNNSNGAVLVNVGTVSKATGSGAPTTSYGFIRFRARVN